MSTNKYYNPLKGISYNNRIYYIAKYFNISNETAVYIYHRARRAYPWTPLKSLRHMEFPPQILNAIVKADKLSEFNVANMRFGNEREYILSLGINVNLCSTELPIYLNDKSEWTKVVNKRKEKIKQKILRSLNLITYIN